MDAEQVRVRALELLKNHQLTVISTVDEVRGAPESAVVAFAERADLSIIFGTSNGSRKYQNLQKNPHVSFVTGWDPRVGSLQYEGIAKELSANEATQYVELMALKNKQTEKFIARKDQRYFLVKPTWLRLIDSTPTSGGKYELIF